MGLAGITCHPVVSEHNDSKEETSMRFYTQTHEYYCGIDLHARSLYICILDQTGT